MKRSNRYWVVFKETIVKVWIEMKRYLANTVSGFVTMYLVFVLLFFGVKAMGGGVFQTGEGLAGLVVGYMVWMLAIFSFQDLAYGISNEAMMGTLEQLYLSPTGFAWVNTARLLAGLFMNLVMLAVILLAMMLTSGQWLDLNLASVAPLILITVAASYGIGFILAGLSLVYKRIQALFQIITFGLIACVAAPVGRYAWMKLVPLAMGNDLLQRVMVDGTRIWDLPAGDLLLGTAVGLGYFVLGLAGFGYCVKVARDKGLMGQY